MNKILWKNSIFLNLMLSQTVIHIDIKITKISGKGKSINTAIGSFNFISNQLIKWSNPFSLQFFALSTEQPL
jgi:hypothetical protein